MQCNTSQVHKELPYNKAIIKGDREIFHGVKILQKHFLRCNTEVLIYNPHQNLDYYCNKKYTPTCRMGRDKKIPRIFCFLSRYEFLHQKVTTRHINKKKHSILNCFMREIQQRAYSQLGKLVLSSVCLSLRTEGETKSSFQAHSGSEHKKKKTGSVGERTVLQQSSS